MSFFPIINYFTDKKFAYFWWHWFVVFCNSKYWSFWEPFQLDLLQLWFFKDHTYSCILNRGETGPLTLSLSVWKTHTGNKLNISWRRLLYWRGVTIGASTCVLQVVRALFMIFQIQFNFLSFLQQKWLRLVQLERIRYGLSFRNSLNLKSLFNIFNQSHCMYYYMLYGIHSVERKKTFGIAWKAHP